TFAELGGSSLQLVKLAMKVRTELGFPQASVAMLLDAPTIKDQANLFEKFSPISSAPQQIGDAGNSQTSYKNSSSQSWLVAPLQLAGLLIMLLNVLGAITLSNLVFTSLPSVSSNFFISNYAWLPLRLIFIAVFQLASLIVLKWLIVGRHRSGKFPIWGQYHYRV